MKVNYTLLTVVCLCASVPLAWMFLNRRSAHATTPTVRFATFNAAMTRDDRGAMLAELKSGECKQAKRIAEIVQRCAIDVLLVCELDRDDAEEAMAVFADRYLAVGQGGQAGIDFP